jgi:hypothetical protein
VQNNTDNFDFINYVVGNKSTLGERLKTIAEKSSNRQKLAKGLIREQDEEDEDWTGEDEFTSSEFEKEPTKKDLKTAGSVAKGYDGKRSQLAKLTQQKDNLLKQLKSGTITIDQYKAQIGTIPQQIKTLTSDLASMGGVDDEEPIDEKKVLINRTKDKVMENPKNMEEPVKTPWYDIFETYNDTDINGYVQEMAIDELIEEAKNMIKRQIPSQDQNAARIAVKKLWLEKIAEWKGLNTSY